MAPDDSSGGRPAAPIVLRIKLRYDDLESMVQRFAANVGKSGLFLPTRSMQPIGAEVKFELRLADDTPALVGLGRVKAVKPPDPHSPKAAFGMAVELMRVTPQSRALILRMLERRRELGFPEVGLPTAADIDAARRIEPETGRDVATGPVPLVTPPDAPATAPPVVAAAAPVGEGLLTAPRRTTGPIAVAKVAAIAPLPPEPPRRPRAAVSEILERASGPVVGLAAAGSGLDDDVDLAMAIARARALAGGALDSELEALCEVAAAPLEISVEAASAELARQLGGSAVRRDRSAGWAPPPATSAELPGDARSGNGAASNGAATVRPAAADAALVNATAHAIEDAARAAPAKPAAEDAAPVAPAEPAAQDAELGPAAEPAAQDAEPVPAAEPAAEDAAPVAAAEPAAEDAAPEAEAGVPARSFGLPHIEGIRTEPSVPVAVLFQGEEGAERAGPVLADLDGDEHTELGAMPVAAGGFELPVEPGDRAPAEAELAGGFALAIEPPLQLGVDEFDDFEIIAEADADDEDLLASHGEHDASSRRGLAARPATGERRPSELDFAARLDLGDDSDLYLGASADEISAGRVIDSLQDELTGQHPARHERFAGALPDPHAISAGAALAALAADDEADDDAGNQGDDDGFDDSEVTDDPDAYAHRVVRPIFDPDPSSSFTLAGIPSDSIDVDLPAPRPARRHAPLSLHEAPVEDDELEHALEALDVDLDDLSIPRAPSPLRRERSRPTPQLRPPGAARTPAPGVRVPQPAPSPSPRASQPTPAPPHRVPQPTPAPRAAAPTPSRAVRPTGLGAPGPGRIAPRLPSESVDIDLDDDD